MASTASSIEQRRAVGFTPRYRADVDGLRAIAVLCVVLYHSFPTLLPSGYVGVDIFFVISGFLITTILLAEIDVNHFSLVRFYSRRVQRLFPALIAVLGAVSVAAWLLLFPDELKDLGSHLLGAFTFTSNFTLWNQSGYFDAAAQSKPLRMLWSLAVEEQFYLLWPISLALVMTRRANPLWVVLALIVVSFVVNLVHATSDPAAAYYSPLSRMWEPLVGCALALFEWNTFHTSPARATGARLKWQIAEAMAGMLLIAVSVVAIPESADFPGYWALAPTLGTALILHSGDRNWVTRGLLSWPALVFVGLISYPLYLWHWPLLSFARIVQGSEPSAWVRSICLCLALLLSLCTWLWLERPVRRHRTSVVTTALAICFCMASGAAGWWFSSGDGFPNRASIKNEIPGNIAASALDEYFSTLYAEFHPCSGRLTIEAPKYHNFLRCFQSKEDRPIDLAIIGDSHAEQLFLGFAEQLPEKNVAMHMDGSIPLVSNPEFRDLYQTLVADNNIKTVMIVSFWSPSNRREAQPKDLRSAILATIMPLVAAGKDVYLSEDTPNFWFDASRCKYRRLIALSGNFCEESSQYFLSQVASYAPVFEQIARDTPRVHILNMADFFCDASVCKMDHAGEIIFRDRDHLNVSGSRYVAAEVLKAHPELGR